MLFAYWILATVFLSRSKVKSLTLSSGRIVEEFKPKQCLKTMAVLTHKVWRVCSQKTVGRISFEIHPRTLGGLFRVPLVSIVAGCTGDIARQHRFCRQGVKKWKKRFPALNLSGEINKFLLWVMPDGRNFVPGNTVFRMAGIAHLFYHVCTRTKFLGPQSDLVFAVMNEVTDTAGSRLSRSLTYDVPVIGCSYAEVMISLFNMSLVWMTVCTQSRYRGIF